MPRIDAVRQYLQSIGMAGPVRRFHKDDETLYRVRYVVINTTEHALRRALLERWPDRFLGCVIQRVGADVLVEAVFKDSTAYTQLSFDDYLSGGSDV